MLSANPSGSGRVPVEELGDVSMAIVAESGQPQVD
jgi:hypothetical protein